MVPIEKQMVITALGLPQRSPNGNGYLVCQTAEGEVVLWLAPDPAPQLRQLQALTLPCRVRLPCLKDREMAGRFWVPESARLVVEAEQQTTVQPEAGQMNAVQALASTELRLPSAGDAAHHRQPA